MRDLLSSYFFFLRPSEWKKLQFLNLNTQKNIKDVKEHDILQFFKMKVYFKKHLNKELTFHRTWNIKNILVNWFFNLPVLKYNFFLFYLKYV